MSSPGHTGKIQQVRLRPLGERKKAEMGLDYISISPEFFIFFLLSKRPGLESRVGPNLEEKTKTEFK